jgi:mannosylglycerate hydrolase
LNTSEHDDHDTAVPGARPGIVLVPHTHWDREWYEPFQVFRYRLVEAMDDVLAMAERDPRFRFTLDGQSAAIEDYLEIRPENEARVRALVVRGQLAIGPWLILLDEFLCSGETIVRNLQLGWASAERLGGAMRLGYLPDMFGHVAQMPQILARAGLEHTAFWRGVPGRVDGHAFRWVAPDGSSVRAEYLFDGYGNALDMLLVPDRIPEALAAYEEKTAGRWGRDPVLGMVGTDHMAPNPALMDWVRRFETAEYPIGVATLEQYVTALRPDADLPEVVGELRSHARGNILPGVISIRLGLKEAMARAERTLAEAERLGAAFSTSDHSPFLERAWRKVVESTAHDSVVGSGTDETVEQVGARLAEAGQIARAVRDGVIAEVAATVSRDRYLVANPLPTARVALVEVEVPAPDESLGVVATADDGSVLRVQEVGSTPVLLGDEQIEGAEYERVLNRIHRRELFGQDIDRYTIEPGRLTFEVAQVPTTPEFDLFRLRAELAEATRAHPGPWHVRTLAEPRRRVLVEVPVGPLSTATFVVGQGRAAVSDGGAHADGRTLGNELVSAVVEADGTVTITGADGTVLRGVGRLVDGGDRGDSYNYGPPAHDVLVDEPASVQLEVLESGPLRAAIRVRRTYDWPGSLAGDVDRRTTTTLPVSVDTTVEVRAGESFVRLAVEFVNAVRDHRVRLHVPLGLDVEFSEAEGQFGVTRRGRTAEGGWGEFPLPTYPADGFVTAGPATVLLDHATEYEVVDGADGAELALTLLRAVGSISVNLHPLRDEPAASEIPIPGGQELGTNVVARVAVIPDAGGWRGARAVARSDEFRFPALVRRGTASGAGAPRRADGIAVSGEGVQVTSLRRVTGGLELRLVALTPEPVTAGLTGDFDSVTEVDLLGRLGARRAAAGSLALDLGPWEIRTVLLSGAASA